MTSFWTGLVVLGIFSLLLIVNAILRDKTPPTPPWENQ